MGEGVIEVRQFEALALPKPINAYNCSGNNIYRMAKSL